MTIIRIAVAPAIAKPLIAAVDELVRQIAQTPLQEAPSIEDPDPPADAFQPCITSNQDDTTTINPPTSADAPTQETETQLATKLTEIRRLWQPAAEDDWQLPTLAQQRADAFTVLFNSLDIQLTTEVVIHVRGDGNTFDDGTPITTSAILRQLDESFVRLMIHDAERRPINASNRRRHPTTRQKRVVLETHNHQCADCQTTDLLQLDHNPPYEQTQHTITTELEPRCAPCHRARHRIEPS